MPAEALPAWLQLVATLPRDDPAARMRIVRTLEALGAGVMREGTYLMPDTPANRQGLESLADYIGKAGGTAQVLRASALSAGQHKTLRRLFDRTARYEELVKVIESLKVSFGISDPGAISRVLHKQRQEFDAISALDFFPSEVKARAEGALGDAESAVRKMLFPQAGAAAAAPKASENFHRRIWATRRPLWADRLACAWLIRRFIDPEGTVAWMDKGQDCPPVAVGFAFEGARFGNDATQVCYEVMLKHFQLADNAALLKVGSIVHFLETRENPVAEAAGVQTLLQGAQRRVASDDEFLAEAEKTFDLLYEAYFQPPGG